MKKPSKETALAVARHINFTPTPKTRFEKSGKTWWLVGCKEGDQPFKSVAWLVSIIKEAEIGRIFDDIAENYKPALKALGDEIFKRKSIWEE